MSIPASRAFGCAFLLAVTVLTGCSRNSNDSATSSTPRVNNGACIKPDANARNNILTAIFEASAGDVVSLCEGKFDMPTGLLINSKSRLSASGPTCC